MQVEANKQIQRVQRKNDLWHVIRPDETCHAIKLSGLPVSAFFCGWRPTVLIDLNTSVGLPELMHENGKKATWFVDENYNHLTDQFDQLPTDAKNTLLEIFSKLLAPIFESLRTASPLKFTGQIALTSINETTIRAIVKILDQKSRFICEIITAEIFGI